MVGDSHLSLDGGVELQGEIAWLCHNCAVDLFRGSQGRREVAIIDVVVETASLGKERKVAQGRTLLTQILGFHH